MYIYHIYIAYIHSSNIIQCKRISKYEMRTDRKIERARDREKRGTSEIGGWGGGWGGVTAIIFDMKWAVPGGTAIPGQPVARAEQAPDISPLTKNQFNIVVPM